jgi:hypothetical protein
MCFEVGRVIESNTGQSTTLKTMFVGEEFLNNGVSVVEAAANGRRAAVQIQKYLSDRAK